MLPIRTARLTIRVMQPDDAPVVAAYRDDPEVAAMQNWPLPYPLERAEQLLAEQAGLTEPDPDGWTQLALDHEGRMIGDLALRLQGGGIAEIGWTLAREAHGQGFAQEAAAAVVAALFAGDVHRIEAMMHPDNIASARVAEAIGMIAEGVTRLTFLGREGWEDDLRYAMCRDEWEAWVQRPRHAPAEVRLVEIGPDNARNFRRQVTHRSQERFVAPTWKSFEDALFPEEVDGAPVVPWMRGIEADGEPAGFVMMAEVTTYHPEPYLWRLLIGRLHQRRGIAGRVLATIIEQLRADGHRTMMTSWVDGPGSPRPFYEGLGFVPTGDLDDGEIVARLTL